MTVGQILFYSGIGVFVLALLLGVLFRVKKLHYQPNSTIYETSGDGKTQPLRNSYPTDRLTIRRTTKKSKKSAAMVQTEQISQIPETERLAPQEELRKTELLSQEERQNTNTGK